LIFISRGLRSPSELFKKLTQALELSSMMLIGSYAMIVEEDHQEIKEILLRLYLALQLLSCVFIFIILINT